VEQTIANLARDAAWVFFIGFIFAVIGVVATIRWIVSMVTRGANAVEDEARKVGNAVTHHGGDGQ
jgi:hypothetical protein